MPYSLSIASVIEKNKLASSVAFLPLLQINVYDPENGGFVEQIRLVRNNEPITFKGLEYQPVMFDIEFGSENGAQYNVELSITDMTKVVQRKMDEYGGGIGFTVTLMIVNSERLNEREEIAEYFEVVGASTDRFRASFTLGAENILAKSFPRRKQTRDFCQWRYKDPNTCRYTGAMPTCDLTLQGPNGCGAHNNSLNFGGFPGIVIRQI